MTSAPLTILNPVQWNWGMIVALLACVVFWVLLIELVARAF